MLMLRAGGLLDYFELVGGFQNSPERLVKWKHALTILNRLLQFGGFVHNLFAVELFGEAGDGEFQGGGFGYFIRTISRKADAEIGTKFAKSNQRPAHSLKALMEDFHGGGGVGGGAEHDRYPGMLISSPNLFISFPNPELPHIFAHRPLHHIRSAKSIEFAQGFGGFPVMLGGSLAALRARWVRVRGIGTRGFTPGYHLAPFQGFRFGWGFHCKLFI